MQVERHRASRYNPLLIATLYHRPEAMGRSDQVRVSPRSRRASS